MTADFKSSHQPGEACRVVIAEDDVAMRNFLAEALTRTGHRVTPVSDAGSALDLIDTGACDLLLSDIRMPGIDGVDLARRARESIPDLPVLFVTGFAGDAWSAPDLMGDRTKVLAKPFYLWDLLRQVAKLLGR